MAALPGTIDSKEPPYFGLPKHVIPSWVALCEAQDANPYYPCKDNPYFYMDYDNNGFEDSDGNYKRSSLSADDCEALCADCPLLKQCYDFAIASEQEYGIWGGINFGAKTNEENGLLF